MRKVLAGGTFNLVHPGHLLFLRKARELGDYLVVVVANDRTVRKSKGFLLMPAEARMEVIGSLRFVDRAVIGDPDDFMKIVRKERPDVIALGYDQTMNESELAKEIGKMGMNCRIVRIKAEARGYKTERILKRLK